MDLHKFAGVPSFWYVQKKYVMQLLRQQAGLRPDHIVLDIGAGPLRIGARLISYLDAGNYYAIEPRVDILKAAQALVPELLKSKKPHFNHNSDFSLDVFEQRFDVVLAHNVFIHCGQEQFRACLACMSAVLRDQGTFVCSLFLSDADRETGQADRHTITCRHASHYFVYYQRKTVCRMVEDAGLQVVDCLRWGHGAFYEKRHAYHAIIRKACS